MSYILEALKKSDKKRQQDESVSTLHQTHPIPPAIKREKSKRDLQIKLSVVVILLLIGLISYRLIIKPPLPIDEDPLVNKPSGPPAEVQTTTNTPAPIPELRPGNKKILIAAPDTDSDIILEPKPLTPIESPTPVAPQQPEDTTPYLEELPLSFQDTVPKFKLAGHVFSPDPKMRLIMINNKIVREGETLGDSLILHEITRDGVILDKNAERFRLKAY